MFNFKGSMINSTGVQLHHEEDLDHVLLKELLTIQLSTIFMGVLSPLFIL